MILYILQSKVSGFHHCNNNSQNKITHTNRNNNIHRLRQGMTFVVYTEELVGWRSTHMHADIYTSTHGRRPYSWDYLGISNWDLNWLEAWGPCLAARFVCLLFLPLRSFRKCLFRDEWLAEMSRGFLLIGGFLERHGGPATVSWLNGGGSGALPSNTAGIVPRLGGGGLGESVRWRSLGLNCVCC